jgi:hypothetical protein
VHSQVKAAPFQTRVRRWAVPHRLYLRLTMCQIAWSPHGQT